LSSDQRNASSMSTIGHVRTESMQQSPSRVPQLVKKFLALNRTRRLITVNTTVRYLSLSAAGRFHPTSFSPILILSSHLCVGLQICLFPSGIHTKTCMHFLPRRATCPVYFIFSICIMNYLTVNSSPFSRYVGPPPPSGLHISLSTPFSNTSQKF